MLFLRRSNRFRWRVNRMSARLPTVRALLIRRKLPKVELVGGRGVRVGLLLPRGRRVSCGPSAGEPSSRSPSGIIGFFTVLSLLRWGSASVNTASASSKRTWSVLSLSRRTTFRRCSRRGSTRSTAGRGSLAQIVGTLDVVDPAGTFGEGRVHGVFPPRPRRLPRGWQAQLEREREQAILPVAGSSRTQSTESLM